MGTLSTIFDLVAASRTLLCSLLLGVLATPCLADSLLLTSGEKLIGKVVSEGAASVVFESAALGKIEVPRDRIQKLEKDEAGSAAAATVPGAQAAPAPATQPASPAPATAATQPVGPAPGAPTAQQKEDLLRMYWDQGLRYQVSQPILVPNFFTGGERVVGEEVRISGRLGLRASLDAADFVSKQGEQELPSDADIRTFRLYTTGEFGLSGRTLYAVQLGSVSGDFYLHEAYLRRPGVPYVGNVTFGYFGLPQTLENIYPFGSLVFMEAASPSLAFAPGNRMGLQVDRTYANDRVYAAFGIFSVGADPGLNFGDATQSLLRPTMRVTGLPILDEKGRHGHRLLHLGGSLSYVLANGPEIQYRARPESFLAPYVVDTGVISASHAFVGGLEAVYIDGPLTVQSEYIWTRVDGDAARYHFDGYYASASWFLTGEQRPYDKTSASVGLIQPRKELSWNNKTWGAWELALRYSRLNLNSGLVRGGDMGIAMLGLNWYWNRYLRWQFNYGYAEIEEGPSPGHLHIFQARLQLMY